MQKRERDKGLQNLVYCYGLFKLKWYKGIASVMNDGLTEAGSVVRG